VAEDAHVSELAGDPLGRSEKRAVSAAKPLWAVLNQSQSPAHQRMLELLSSSLGRCVLYTGTPYPAQAPSLQVVEGPAYLRGSQTRRVISWLRFLAWSAWRAARLPRDAFLLAVTNPPLLPHLAWLLKRTRGLTYGVLVWDIYPDLLVASGFLGRNHLLVRAWRWVNRKALDEAQLVVTLGDSMAETLRGQLSRNRPVIVIPNWTTPHEIRPLPKDENSFAREHGQVGMITILYAGNIGTGHGLERLVAAAKDLESDDRVCFLMVGDGLGLEAVLAEIRVHTPRNLQLVGYQSWERVPGMLATGDIAVVSQEVGLEHLSMPSKAYSSLAAGSALLALTSPDSDLGRLVAENNVGVVCSQSDPSGIASVLREMVSDPLRLQEQRSNARRVAVEILSEEVVYSMWQRALTSVIGPDFEVAKLDVSTGADPRSDQ